MAGKFRLHAHATVTHINARKEGPDDDKVLAVDVKLQTLLDFDILNFFEPALAAFLYLQGGAVRNTLMGPITFTHELEHYRLDIAGGSHFGTKVKKFSIEPRDSYKVLLTFLVSFKPSGDEVAQIAEYLQDDLLVSLEPENEELDLTTDSTAAPAPSTHDDLQQDITYGTDCDPIYSDAIRVVADTRRASISTVQRHLCIGYNRAARLIEAMEKDGYVTPMNSSGSRDVTPLGLEQAA